MNTLQQNSREQSRRAKARWTILRNALLQGKSNTIIDRGGTSTCNGGKSNASAVVANNGINSGDEISSFSIHRFKGFQVLSRKIIQSPSHATADDNDNENAGGSGNIAADSDNKCGGSNNEGEYHDKYEYVEYEIPLDDKNIDSGVIKIRTREKKQQLQSNNKMNMKELMSHMYYGVDNTGNTRVWECSKILTRVVITAMTESIQFPTSTRSVICTDNAAHSLLPRQQKSKCDSELTPTICLNSIISRSRPVLRCRNGSTYNILPKRRLRIIELGSGMAALPSLALAALAVTLGKMTEKNAESANRVSDEDDNNFGVPYMDIVVTDGHPKSVVNNEICSKLTLNLLDNQITAKGGTGNINTKHKQEEEEDDNDGDDEDSSQFCSIETKRLLWKANDEGWMECQSFIKRVRKNDDVFDDNNHNYSDHFDLVLVSDCTHFTEFHAGLIATIGRLLRVNGVCFLCQPKRGSSLDLFIKMITAMNNNCSDCNGSNDIDHDNSKGGNGIDCVPNKPMRGPLFESRLYQDYSDHISNQHQELLKRQGDKIYDPNIHYPVILELKKLREYNEDVDTNFASFHVRQRQR